MAARIDPAAIDSTAIVPTAIDLTATDPATAIPTVIIIGGDALALSTAREIGQVSGHRVVVLWPADAEFAAAVEEVGAVFIAGRPDSSVGLEAAGVRHAISVLALSRDDQLNGFAYRTADREDLAEHSVSEVEETLGARIVAIDGNTSILADDRVAAGARLIVYATLDQLLQSTPRQPIPEVRSPPVAWLRDALRRLRRRLHRIDPYIALFAAATLALFAVATWHFHYTFDSD